LSIVCLSYRRGFSLTEGVIVIGVVGIIVGGLFAMIAPTQTQTKSNQSLDQLGVIVITCAVIIADESCLPLPLVRPRPCLPLQILIRMPPFGSMGWSADQYKNIAIFPPEMIHIGSVAWQWSIIR